jgi:diguanylate cyclase (GGDEF)-like protein/PAS domain S-box-containing protein
VFVVLVLGGVSLGSAGILGASVRAFACFTAPILLAQTVELFTLGGTLYNTMGVMAILFIGGLVTSYQEFRSALLASIDARTDMERIHREQRLIFESVTAGVAFIRDRKIVDHNSQFAKMLGYEPRELINQSTRVYYHDDAKWRQVGETGYAVLQRGEAFREEYDFRTKAGGTINCDATMQSVIRGKPEFGVVAILNDITLQKEREAALRAALLNQLAIFSNAPAGIIMTRRRQVEDSNEFMAKMLRCEQADLVGHDTSRWFTSRERWDLRGREIYEAFACGESYSYTEELVRKDGTRFWCRVRGGAADPNEPLDGPAVFVMVDVTDQLSQEAEIRRLALEDPLTGLPNRRLLDDRLERALSSAARNEEQVAVLMIDLDGFKDVNDEHGHAAGDVVLKTLGARLKDSVRESDTVARVGGDEFLVIVRAVQQSDDACRLAEKLLATISEPVVVEGKPLRVGASIGIALYPTDTLHPAQLVRLADTAMYQVKQAGRDGYRLAADLVPLAAGE